MRLRIPITISISMLALLGSMRLSLAEVAREDAPPTRGQHRFRIPKASAVRLQFFKADPPEVALGERLFLETRFAQFFFAHSHGNANAVLTEGDPVLATSQTASGQSLPGPFAAFSMNCRACHLVAEQ